MSGKKIFRIFPRLTMGRKRGIIYVWRIKAHSRNGKELTIMSEKKREIRIQIHGRIREKNIVLTGPYGAGKSSSVFFFSE